MELVKLNNKMSDCYQLTLPLGSNNRNSFVYILSPANISTTVQCCF